MLKKCLQKAYRKVNDLIVDQALKEEHTARLVAEHSLQVLNKSTIS